MRWLKFFFKNIHVIKPLVRPGLHPTFNLTSQLVSAFDQLTLSDDSASSGSSKTFPLFLVPSQEKCAQYWPTSEEREMAFRDTRFLVTLLSEDTKSYYTTRVLELQNINVGLTIILLKWFRGVKAKTYQTDLCCPKLLKDFCLFILLWFLFVQTFDTLNISSTKFHHPTQPQ